MFPTVSNITDNKFRKKLLLATILCVLYYLFYCIFAQSVFESSNKFIGQIIQQQLSVRIKIASDKNLTAPTWKSNRRGYVALLYSGTARSFTANFESHIVNLMAGCPYTVHLFLHSFTNDNRFPDRLPNSSYANYLSVNATLGYFEGYINLDNEQVLFRDAVKANVFEFMPVETLRQTYNDTYDISMQRFPGHPPIPGIYYMWHSQRRCEESRQKYMSATGIDYKWTFRMRYDAVYYTNWWQQAFDVKVYNSSNSLHKLIAHDVTSDWGVRPTRLYDMIYEPRLQTHNVLYLPLGWDGYHAYNDQFGVMSSENAKHYFMRILHVDRMLREDKVHPETSIYLVAQWNNMTADDANATMCYDIVRASLDVKQNANNGYIVTRSCGNKGSGTEDCTKLCPKFAITNRALHVSFLHQTVALPQNLTTNVKQLESLLMKHLLHINNDPIQVDYHASSFYYFYRYADPIYMSDPCAPDTWTKDQSNIYATRDLPFILRASDPMKLLMYNHYLTCGPLIRTNSAPAL